MKRCSKKRKPIKQNKCEICGRDALPPVCRTRKRRTCGRADCLSIVLTEASRRPRKPTKEHGNPKFKGRGQRGEWDVTPERIAERCKAIMIEKFGKKYQERQA